MANSNKITIVIDADGRAYIQGMEKVAGSTKELETQTSSITQQLKAHWLGAAAAIYAAQRTIRTAWNMAEISAQYEEQRASLQAMTGQADALISRIQDASKGMISLSQAAGTAGVGIMKGLSSSQLVELAEAAETLSNITGEKVAVSFRSMTEAIALGRERALEASIGIIDLNARFGEQVSKMTEAEKQAARYAIVMAKVREVQAGLGLSVASTSDRMEQFTASLQDLQLTIGSFVIKGGAALLGAFQWVAAGALTAAQGVIKLWEYYNRFMAWLGGEEDGDVFARAAERAKLEAEAVGQAAQDMTGKAAASFALLQKSGEEVVETYKKVRGISAAVAPIKGSTPGDEDKEHERLISLSEKKLALLHKYGIERERDNAAAAKAFLEEKEIADGRYSFMGIQLQNEEKFNAMSAQGAQARANITGAAYQAMQDQILALVEVGKFSTAEFGRVIVSQVKMELAGIAAISAVKALYYGAVGLGLTALGDPRAIIAFNAAAGFALISGAALAATAGVQAAFGGQAARPAAGSIGGEPIRTMPGAPSAYPAPERPETKPTQNVTVIVQNGTGDSSYWQKLIDDVIVPGINDATSRNINLTVRTA